MAWQGPRTVKRDRWDRDPLYIANRATVRAQRDPCARCHRPIDYDAPYWLEVRGRRTINPLAFHCGHIVDRARGGSHDLTNLQAEHAGCSLRAGAQLGQMLQRAALQQPPKRRARVLVIEDW